jgi:hypothetical protein
VLGGGGYINPEQFALNYAREQANNQMLMGAEDRARGIQAGDLTKAMGYLDSANALSMRPYQNINSLFGMGADVEGLGYNTLNTVGQFAPIQAQWQQAQQANQQAINNAKASGGSFGSQLLNSAVNAGIGYATGGMSGAVMGGAQGLFGGGASTPGFGGGSFGFGGTSPLSNWTSSLFGNGLGGVSPTAGAYSINQNPYLNWGA